MRKCAILLVLLAGIAVLGFVACTRQSDASSPVEMTFYYADNSTLPFKNDWLAIQRAQELANAKITWEVIPMGADFTTKVSLALNSGINTPDVILGIGISGEYIPLAQNGAIVPISDYANWTPEWVARVREYGLQSDIDMLRLLDGKYYNLASLTDKPFYDSGIILREDLLQRYGLAAPTTFDELANFMRRYKQENPSSYPLTQYYGPRIMYRMIQNSWGFHANRNAVSRVLSYDYSRNTYFAGAISDQYRDFMRFWSKLYAEGLIDPEIAEPISDDSWARKLANGTSIATYAWYDQIGGITAASTIPGFKLNLYPPLRGPVGAHHVPQSKTAGGPIFPIATSQRADFERVVRAVDTMFFSKEAETLWCLGVEGQTYTMQGNTVNFIPSLVNSPDGVYKAGQLQYGIGVGGLQYLWVNAREMTKYDDYYAQLNNTVAAMPNAIRSTAPSPKYPDTPAGIRDAERADALMMTLWDIYVVWDNNFLTGAKSIESDWNAFVNEMTSSGINEFLTLYNNNLQR